MESKSPESMIMIPKYRYDEVNSKFKETKLALAKMKKLADDRGQAIETLLKHIEEMQIYLEHSLMNLQVKETFVEGGITKSQYEMIIPKMTCRDEEKLELAEAIVELIHNQSERKR